MSVLLKASEAKAISEENKTQYTKDWIAAHLDAAIREASGLGYNKIYLSYQKETPYSGWGSYEREGQFFCPWGDNIDWNLVRNELESLGYGITNISNSEEKAIACISWFLVLTYL